MLSMMLIAATLAGANTSPVTASRITSGAGNAAIVTQPAAASEKRYCVKTAVTGSRLARKTCQTRAEWLQQGFDPLEK